jgi:uncharacterized repeat protein (TIGR03943 family)
MKIDRRRAARAFVLAVWTGFFGWLWLSAELIRYIGPRTQWVVFFGTVALAVATVAYLRGMRTGDVSPLTFGDGVGLAILLVPVLTVVVVPAPDLGALAASRRSSGNAVGAVGAFAPTAGAAGGKLSFLEIDYASRSSEYAATAGVAAGRRVRLLGFVSEVGSNGGFRLTRFYIACCAADAIPYTVRVEANGGGRYAQDQWLEVAGELAVRGRAFVLVAEHVTPRTAPRNPYLS